MLKQIFGSRPTTKFDVIFAVGAALLAIGKAVDTHHTYKSEQEEIQRSATTNKKEHRTS